MMLRINPLNVIELVSFSKNFRFIPSIFNFVSCIFPRNTIHALLSYSRTFCNNLPSLTILSPQNRVVQIVDAHQTNDMKEREISRQIAGRYPLRSPPHGTCERLSSTPTLCKELCSDSPKNELPHPCSCDAKAPLSFPPPLSADAIDAALSELPAGSGIALVTCVRCWRDGRLGADEVVATARSFAGASPALARALSALAAPASPAAASAPRGEVATPEEMDELVRLARPRRPAAA